MKPIIIDAYNPASVPTLHDLIERARCALIERYAPRAALSPLTDAEKADALAFARSCIESDLNALRQRFFEVKETAETAQRFLDTSDLPAAARLYLNRTICGVQHDKNTPGGLPS